MKRERSKLKFLSIISLFYKSFILLIDLYEKDYNLLQGINLTKKYIFI